MLFILCDTVNSVETGFSEIRDLQSMKMVSDFVRSLAALTIFWGILMLTGFPYPYIDDNFFIGAAINLAKGGGLVNPLMEHVPHFYAYPPLYSYLVASWLKVFGVSAHSIAVYHTVLCWLTTWFTIRTFQIIGKQFQGWMVVAVMAVYFTCMGLRPDAAGWFFVSLAIRSYVSPRFRMVSPMAAMLAVMTLPATIAFAVPWLVFILIKDRRMWVASLLGGLAVLVLAGLMLNWRFMDFWAGFSQNAGASSGCQIRWFKENWARPMGFMKYSFPVLTCFSLMGFCIWKRGLRRIDPVMFLAVILGIYSSTTSVSGTRVLSVITVALIGFYTCQLPLERSRNRLILLACTLLMLGFSIRTLIQGLTVGKPTNGPELLSEVNDMHPSRVLVDVWTLRYVFDYQIRPGMFDVGCADHPETRARRIIKYPDECWVVSAEGMSWGMPSTPGMPARKPVVLFGKALGAWTANPGEIKILPPTDNPQS